MAGYSVTSVGQTSVTIHVTVDAAYSIYRIFVRYASEVAALWDKTISRTSDFSYTVSGLAPGTDYAINVATHNGTSTVHWFGAEGFTTDMPPHPTIEPFLWTVSNGSATAVQTKAAHSAMTSSRPAEYFSYKVWNDIVSKIAKSVDTAGGAWSSVYAVLSATQMNAPSVLAAAQYNSARYNIERYYPTGILEVSSGNEFTWAHIDRLVIKLNEWILNL